MGGYIILCVACYILGIGAIGGSFYVQRLEDLHRPKGYHLKATLKKITELNGGRRRLDFAFFLFGKPIKCSAVATLEESRPVQLGRDYFVVYDDEAATCIFNPCQRYRVIQAALIIAGIFVTLFAVLLTVYGVALYK